MGSTEEIQFWEEFIDIYHENPCLWNEKCIDYEDESKRNIAHGLLLEKLWDIDENADIDTVKKKITYFKSSFDKCVSKIKRCKENGQRFEPTWCYYKSLSFLTPHEYKTAVEDVPKGVDKCMTEATKSKTDTSSKAEIPQISKTALVKDEEKPMVKLPGSDSDETILAETPRKRRKFSNELNEDDDLEDDCSTFAAYVKAKMRSFDPMQKCIAQKLISDVIFMAETKNLQMTSVISNLAHE